MEQDLVKASGDEAGGKRAGVAAAVVAQEAGEPDQIEGEMSGHGVGGHRHGEELRRTGEQQHGQQRQAGVFGPEAAADPVERETGDGGEDRVDPIDADRGDADRPQRAVAGQIGGQPADAGRHGQHELRHQACAQDCHSAGTGAISMPRARKAASKSARDLVAGQGITAEDQPGAGPGGNEHHGRGRRDDKPGERRKRGVAARISTARAAAGRRRQAPEYRDPGPGRAGPRDCCPGSPGRPRQAAGCRAPSLSEYCQGGPRRAKGSLRARSSIAPWRSIGGRCSLGGEMPGRRFFRGAQPPFLLVHIFAGHRDRVAAASHIAAAS